MYSLNEPRPWSIFSAKGVPKAKLQHSMASLFSGCGGFDLGFHFAGYQLIWANDFNTDACMTYSENLGPIVEGDIVDIGFPNLNQNPDLLAAGFPCQSFSNAGSRRGVQDKRGALYRIALNAIEHFEPRVVVFENVRGLLSVKDGDKLVVQLICERLTEIGYLPCFRLLDASKYGVPQRRLRLIIVGVKDDSRNGVFAFPHERGTDVGLSLEDTIFDIPSSAPNQQELMPLNPQALEIGAMVPEGGSWKNIPYEMLPDRLKRIRDNMAHYRWPKFYRRFARHEVAGTITAAFKPENAGVWHPIENRVLSVREIARIQSFPDWWICHGRSVKSKYQQIGNAVPPKLAYEIALQISDVLNGESPDGIRNFIAIDQFIQNGKPLRTRDPGVFLAKHCGRT